MVVRTDSLPLRSMPKGEVVPVTPASSEGGSSPAPVGGGRRYSAANKKMAQVVPSPAGSSPRAAPGGKGGRAFGALSSPFKQSRMAPASPHKAPGTPSRRRVKRTASNMRASGSRVRQTSLETVPTKSFYLEVQTDTIKDFPKDDSEEGKAGTRLEPGTSFLVEKHGQWMRSQRLEEMQEQEEKIASRERVLAKKQKELEAARKAKQGDEEIDKHTKLVDKLSDQIQQMKDDLTLMGADSFYPGEGGTPVQIDPAVSVPGLGEIMQVGPATKFVCVLASKTFVHSPRANSKASRRPPICECMRACMGSNVVLMRSRPLTDARVASHRSANGA